MCQDHIPMKKLRTTFTATRKLHRDLMQKHRTADEDHSQLYRMSEPEETPGLNAPRPSLNSRATPELLKTFKRELLGRVVLTSAGILVQK